MPENFKEEYARSVSDHWAFKNSIENNLTTDLVNYTNFMNPPTLSAKFRRTDVIPDFYSAGLKYGHINEIWPTYSPAKFSPIR